MTVAPKAGNRWSQLDVRIRRLLLAGVVFEGLLKIAALIDLARRPASQIRGSKWGWAAGIVLINSLGAVPIVYFSRGHRKVAAD